MIINGSDFDVNKQLFRRALCVYWDIHHNVISQPIMWAETLYPVPLVAAVRVFKPETAIGCTVQFEYIDGSLTDPIVYKF